MNGRTGSVKPDWLCNKCERGGAKEPYKNYGSRTSCHSCGGTKRSCYLRDAKASGSPTTSLAERQLNHAKSEDKKEKEIRKLRAQLVAKDEVAKKLAARGMRTDVDDEEPEEDEEPRLSMDQLVSAKALYDSWGAAGKALSEEFAGKIAEARKAALATKPVHVQLERAYQRVHRAKTACNKHGKKAEALHAAKEALEKELLDFATLQSKEKLELAEAEEAYAMASKVGHDLPDGAGDAARPANSLLDSSKAMLESFADNLWVESGVPKASFQKLMDLALAAQKKEADRKSAAEAAAAAVAKAAADAAAVAAKEKARLATEAALSTTGLAASIAALPLPAVPPLGGSSSSLAADGDTIMADVLAHFGVHLDLATKRSLLEAQDKDKESKRRKVPM